MDIVHGKPRGFRGVKIFSLQKVERVRKGLGKRREETGCAGKKVLQMGPGCLLACDVVDVSLRDAKTPFFRVKTADACAVFLNRREIVCVGGVT